MGKEGSISSERINWNKCIEMSKAWCEQQEKSTRLEQQHCRRDLMEIQVR